MIFDVLEENASSLLSREIEAADNVGVDANLESSNEFIEIYRFSDKKRVGESFRTGLVIKLSHPL